MISWQALNYGWLALTTLGDLTGPTIFVTNNVRQEIRVEDVIPVAIGVYERCLGTQYQTNPALYRVTPPEFINTWYSNVYATNGVAIYTNIVTNSFGWEIDRNMITNLQGKVKALAPYYINTNYPLTNAQNWTVTGLFATLKIGDGTNQFTATPGLTNAARTNWYVCYTNYWPTNGATFPTTNSYTATVNQVVNYGASWTATGGVVWINASNWPSAATQTTNAATYGTLPWEIHAIHLVELYKALEQFRWTKVSLFADLTTTNASGFNTAAEDDSTEEGKRRGIWAEAKSDVGEVGYANNRQLSDLGVESWSETFGNWRDGTYYAACRYYFTRFKTPDLWTNQHSVAFYLHGQAAYWTDTDPSAHANNGGLYSTYYDEYGNGILQNTVSNYYDKTSTNAPISYTDILPWSTADFPASIPSWVNEPTNTSQWWVKGQRILGDHGVVKWDVPNGFIYCTNKYW